MDYYVYFVVGDVEPELHGPFDSAEERDTKAKALKEKYGDDNGIYWLDIPKSRPEKKVETGSYGGGFFEE